MKFSKWQGCGNDFVLINCLQDKVADYAAFAQEVCDRHYGVGADGILVRGGSLADATGKEGTSTLLADLMSKGAGKRDAATFAEDIFTRYPADKLGELLLAMAEEGYAQVAAKVTAEVSGVLDRLR